MVTNGGGGILERTVMRNEAEKQTTLAHTRISYQQNLERIFIPTPFITHHHLPAFCLHHHCTADFYHCFLLLLLLSLHGGGSFVGERKGSDEKRKKFKTTGIKIIYSDNDILCLNKRLFEKVGCRVGGWEWEVARQMSCFHSLCRPRASFWEGAWAPRGCVTGFIFRDLFVFYWRQLPILPLSPGLSWI